MSNNDVKEKILDFSDCTYLGEVFAVIKKELELPEWCGENLDALWDAVTGIMYTPVRIKIEPVARRKELQSAVNDIIVLLQEAEQKYREITVIVVD